ncbi:nucleoid-associated protein, partial [Vibrio cholerae]
MNNALGAVSSAAPAQPTITSPIKKLYVYDIDVSQKIPTHVTQSEQMSDLGSFLLRVSQETMTSPNKKLYEFEPTSSAQTCIKEFLTATTQAEEEISSMNLAKLLLDAEKNTSSRVSQLAGIKKGSMVLCHYETNDINCIIVTKLDFESFLERETYSKKQGLPEKKGILKSCVINIDSGILNKDLYLLDSNGLVASFWSKSFFEANQKINDVVNTKNAYKKISRAFVGLAQKSRVDYQQLKNNLISYFSTNTTFVLSDLLDSLIGNYKPVDPDVDLDTIKDKINKLVTDGEFDGTFSIDDKEIKKQYKQTIKLDGGIVITTSDSYNDIIYRKKIDGDDYLI